MRFIMEGKDKKGTHKYFINSKILRKFDEGSIDKAATKLCKEMGLKLVSIGLVKAA